jgi:hypothetical protein
VAKRMLGEPITPAFCISVFISSEPNQVRALGGSDAVSLKESWARPCGGLNEWALVLLD